MTTDTQATPDRGAPLRGTGSRADASSQQAVSTEGFDPARTVQSFRAEDTPPELIEALRHAVEDRCDDCGGPCPSWFAQNELWNLVIGGPEANDDPGGFVCPNCFIGRAEAVGIKPPAWELSK